MSKVTQWFVYILRCRDGSLYTGITNDLSKREIEHNSGVGSKYVRSRGGGVIVYTEGNGDKPTALRRESAIKRLSRAQKLTLIKS